MNYTSTYERENNLAVTIKNQSKIPRQEKKAKILEVDAAH